MLAKIIHRGLFSIKLIYKIYKLDRNTLAGAAIPMRTANLPFRNDSPSCSHLSLVTQINVAAPKRLRDISLAHGTNAEDVIVKGTSPTRLPQGYR